MAALDTNTSISIFREPYLHKYIRQVDTATNIIRVNKELESIRAHQIGEFWDLSTVYHHPNTAANIAIQWVARTADVTYDNKADSFRV